MSNIKTNFLMKSCGVTRLSRLFHEEIIVDIKNKGILDQICRRNTTNTWNGYMCRAVSNLWIAKVLERGTVGRRK